MGLFCVNLHFQTTDDKALSASLNRRGITQYHVLPAKNGWTSLYEERASQQDDERIRELAAWLSADLQVATIAFMVHDSDIACYWLFDEGRLLDEFNSFPDYFDADGGGDEPQGPSGGRPDVLLPYCRAGVREEELAAILAGENLFAENVIEQLALALAIDRERALADYRDLAGGDGPGGFDDDDGGDGDDDDFGGGGLGSGPSALLQKSGLMGRLAKMFGSDPGSAPADPQAIALVQAAADDDLDEMDRLLAAGVAIDAEAPAPIPVAQWKGGVNQILPGGLPKIVMTPLLAAITNKRRRAVERLLDGGADPTRVHPLYGTPVHAATAAGEADLLELLIERGGDVTARNAQGQTPLDVVAASRATVERLAQAQTMIKSMGVQVPGLADQLSKIALPLEGWDACERLLKAQAAR